jgi:hypothetical protein
MRHGAERKQTKTAVTVQFGTAAQTAFMGDFLLLLGAMPSQRTSCPWSPAVGGCSERSQAFVACIAGGRERSAYRRLATNLRITLARRRKNWRIGCHRLAVEALP